MREGSSASSRSDLALPGSEFHPCKGLLLSPREAPPGAHKARPYEGPIRFGSSPLLFAVIEADHYDGAGNQRAICAFLIEHLQAAVDHVDIIAGAVG